jgi:hypothetical protein
MFDGVKHASLSLQKKIPRHKKLQHWEQLFFKPASKKNKEVYFAKVFLVRLDTSSFSGVSLHLRPKQSKIAAWCDFNFEFRLETAVVKIWHLRFLFFFNLSYFKAILYFANVYKATSQIQNRSVLRNQTFLYSV